MALDVHLLLLIYLMVLHPVFWVVTWDSIPYEWQVILIYGPVKDGIVHPYKNRLFDDSSKDLLFPSHNAKIVCCGDVACGGLMAMY